MKSLITEIQRFSLNDGPGIRTTVFFKGCNMKCTWCHNPETLDFDRNICMYPEKCIGCGKCIEVCPMGAHKIEEVHIIDRNLCTRCGKCADVCYAEAIVASGKEMTIDEIMTEILQDKAYYDASGGGVTLSGGEVLCHCDFALEIARECHKNGINVAIESNMSFPSSIIKPLLNEVDLIMADLKIFDDERHKKYTGISNRTTLENLRQLKKPFILRTPLVPGATATQENLCAIAEFIEGNKNLIYYQLLNFNPLGASKYESLDKENKFSEARPYTQEELEEFESWLKGYNLNLKVGD